MFEKFSDTIKIIVILSDYSTINYLAESLYGLVEADQWHK